MELALAALKKTTEKARVYSTMERRYPETVRDYVKDVLEDVAQLETFKAKFGDKADECQRAIFDAKDLKRDMEKDAQHLERLDREKKKDTGKGSSPKAQKSSGIKIPRIKLPVFDGETNDDYRGFKEAFLDTLSKEPDLTSVQKWLLLKDQLAGKALLKVRELPIAPETYDTAVKLLEKNYGSSRRAKLKLFQRLQVLPNAAMDTESLKDTWSQLEGMLLSLERLAADCENDEFLRAVVLSKFPEELNHMLRVTDDTTLKQFRELMGDYVVSRECTLRQVTTSIVQSYGGGPSGSQSKKGGTEGTKGKPRYDSSAVPETGGTATKQVPPTQVRDDSYNKVKSKFKGKLYKCVFCTGSHWADQCDVYKTLTERLKIVLERCQKCLKEKHPNTDCENWKNCWHCKSTEHNRAICPKKFGTATQMLLSEAKGETDVPPVGRDASGERNDTPAEFMTAVLAVSNAQSTGKAEVRTILDTGGGRCLVTRDLVEELALAPVANGRVRLLGVNGVPLTKGSVGAVKLLLTPPNVDPIEVRVNVVDDIVDSAVSTDVAQFKERYPRYANLRMPLEGNAQRVRLLLGYKSLKKIVTLQSSIFVEPGLQLMSTKYGWVPFGGFPSTEAEEGDTATVMLMRDVDPIKLMTDLEAIGLADLAKSETDEEQLALEKFYATTKEIDGRYEVEWPWRCEKPELENNFGLAWGRLQHLYKQLSAEPTILAAYDRIIREHVETGIAEPVSAPTESVAHPVYYLPHRGVIRVGKSTPLRLVFDASARVRRSARSLNDYILKGGNWVTELPGVLIRFRRYGVAVTGDIEKAFHQISIAPKDRDVVRFLWLRDPTKPPTKENLRVFRFKRVAFGVVASPFLLTATIKNHLRRYPNEYAETMEADLYADNLVTSLAPPVDSEKFYQTAKESFQKMSMNLTKWTTNDADLRRAFRKEDALPETTVGVLGLIWNAEEDSLALKSPRLAATSASAVTKRAALKEMASVYDPLGWALPIIMLARIFVRGLWLLEYPWDAPVSAELASEWLGIREQLNRVNEIRLPRCYGANSLAENEEIELHAFCDASKEAYGVVVYLQSKSSKSGQPRIVAAKARLAPKTKLSVPRLELLAAVIACRFLAHVERSLQTKNIKKYLWGDSRCVIAWTIGKRILPGFIEKAVKEIRDAGLEKFLYVPSDQNPADIVSRGGDLATLNQQNWWNGPAWLADRGNWPDQKATYGRQTELLARQTAEELCVEEEKILFFNAVVKLRNGFDPTSSDGAPFQLNPLNFTSLGALLRRTVTCLSACKKFAKTRGEVVRNTQETYKEAKRMWIRWDQKRAYETAKKGKSNASYLQNLRVFEDENGIMRCITRIKWAKVSRDECEPILLVKRSPLTQLIIISIHQSIMHASAAHTLSAIRHEYWLPQGRREVFHAIQKRCFVCRRQKAEPYKAPEMPPLPPFRITKTETPFKNTGLDIFGPFKVKFGKTEIRKCWVVIFTCLVVRAIHLEVLYEMKAEEFLFSLRRFVGRRGVPKLIVSDNAPQFKMVKDYFKIAWKQFATADVTLNYFAEHEIEWRFIPAEAPWMGGVYERMIRGVKAAFEKVYSDTVLTERQFSMAMVETEAVVNSRPVTYIDKDQKTSLITPNHFLCVRYPAIPVNFDRGVTVEELNSAWRAGERYLQEFWKVWAETYLQSIRDRRDVNKNPRAAINQVPREGELVLMIDPTMKRSSWQLAVIEKCVPSKEDGKIRTAIVRVPNRGRLIRPITKLAPLSLMMDLPQEMIDRINVEAETVTVDDTPGFVYE